MKLGNKITIKPEQAQQIIDIACKTWKSHLMKIWSTNICLKQDIIITNEAYIDMRKAFIEEQNILFDQIFGEEELIYEVGDYLYCIKDVIMNSKYRNFTKDKIYQSEMTGCITNNTKNKYNYMPRKFTSKYFRYATPEEIKKFQYIPEGTPCLVTMKMGKEEYFRYSDGNGGFYLNKTKRGIITKWDNVMRLDIE